MVNKASAFPSVAAGALAAPIVLAGALLFSSPGPAHAQAARPDWSGVYQRRAGGTPAGAPVELTPEGEVMRERNEAGLAASDPEIDQLLRCRPAGVPRMLYGPLPFLLLQTPKAIAILSETDFLPRVIYLDRPHRAEYWPTYNGDSVGHWEGDTLVVETIRFVSTTFVSPRGLPHSDEMKVTERWRLIDDGQTLENVATVDDPKVYAAPWSTTFLYDRRDDLQPVEMVCENTRNHPAEPNN